MARCGLDELAASGRCDWGRFGLLCNQSSLASDGRSAVAVAAGLAGGTLCRLFSPQHGLLGTEQDNMKETASERHPGLDLPILSLYADSRELAPGALEGLDTVVVDLPVVGCRVYTFKSSLVAVLRAARAAGCRVVVLDRRNPLGARIEGRPIPKTAASFVGPLGLPFRHGLSMGEFARFADQEIGARPEVVPFDPASSPGPWLYSSPNLPTRDAVHVYPATVLLEATNVSEGRGTTLPFSLIGAPFIADPERFAAALCDEAAAAGEFVARPATFVPTFHKWKGQRCGGLHLTVPDPAATDLFALGRALLRVLSALPGFAWRHPPYEYEYERAPIDLLLGEIGGHTCLENGEDYWSEGQATYRTRAAEAALYPR